MRERHDDIIWRVRWGEKWLYVYLLLEFQSSVSRKSFCAQKLLRENQFMAVRIMVYIGLLYQYLIDSQNLTKKDKLPPVLPVVIYNGKTAWNAAQDISELIEEVPGGLEKYRPHLRYFLIDEGKFADADLAKLHNLVAAIIRLENTRSFDNEKALAEAISQVLNLLVDWLKDSEFIQLRRDIVTFTQKFLRAKTFA